MARLFHSFDDGQMYHIMRQCPLQTLLDEQHVDKGLLIESGRGRVEITVYRSGKPTEFKTIIAKDMDDEIIVTSYESHRCVPKNDAEELLKAFLEMSGLC